MQLYNKKLFLFIGIVFILGFITSYPLARVSYSVSNKYQFLDFNLLYFSILIMLYAFIFVIFFLKIPLGVAIEERDLIMKYLLRNERINYKQIQKIEILYPLQRKPKHKRKPTGIRIVYAGKDKVFSIFDEKIIDEIIYKTIKQGIPIVKKYYEGDNRYVVEAFK